MPSPSKSPKSSPKKSPTGKGGRMNPDARRELGNLLFPRDRYSQMGPIFKKVSEKIGLYVNSLHVYELWNFMPQVEQYSNSNKSRSPKSSPKGSPSRSPKTSPKNKGGAKGKPAERDPSVPDYLPAKLAGVVVVRKDFLKEGVQVFVEVCADFAYSAHSKVPPFPDEVATRCRCYRDVKVVNVVRFTEDYSDDHNQALFSKIKRKFYKGRAFHFAFDLTRKPDSMFFRRPYHYTYKSGLFWTIRAYVAPAEHCEPSPDLQMSMEIFKYTIAPWSDKVTIPPGLPVQHIRHATMDDVGDLVLQGELDRQIYYHGQDIKVKLRIENGSMRHVVHSLAVYVEQTCRMNHQFPQDIVTPIGEVVLGSGDGLPINPKNKQWLKEVTVKPTFDPEKNNLVVDGKMPVDGKVFLANSTIIMISHPIPPPPPPPEPTALEQGGKKSPKASPSKKDNSPKSKSPKKSASPKKSPKKAGGGGKGEPQKPPEPVDDDVEEVVKEEHIMTNKQDCRPAFVFYNVVVRLNLKTPQGDESGHPSLKLPFILTRETRYLDQITKPPTWSIVAKH